MRVAVRGFLSCEDWVEIEGGRILVLYGPNSSGKSALAAALALIRAQRDPFRLSFAEAALSGRSPASFIEAASCPGGRVEYRIGASVDAAAAMAPADTVGLDVVSYDFELLFAYEADPFDGGSSGILVEASIDHMRGGERVRLFSARPSEGRAGGTGGCELFLSARELLALPFVRAKAVGSDEAWPDALGELDRAIGFASDLASESSGEAATKAALLRSCLEAARLRASENRALERLVLPEYSSGPESSSGPAGSKGGSRASRGFRFRRGERVGRYEASELKYLRSLSDIFVAECLAENGLRSMRSRQSGREIRLSFYSAFYEILEACGFIESRKAWGHARFPLARGPSPARGLDACATASGASALVRRAEGEYAAALRDAVNYASCRSAGGWSVEDARLGESYGRAIVSQREAGETLVSEGRERDPEVLDLESRRSALRSFLASCGLADDLEFRLGASEEYSICLAEGGTRSRIADLSEGLRRLVLVASTLLYLPWGSLVEVEEPEAGLDPRYQARMAELLALLCRETGASVVVETRSSDFLSALGPMVSMAERPRKDDVVAEKTRRAKSGVSVSRALGSEDGLVRLVELSGRATGPR